MLVQGIPLAGVLFSQAQLFYTKTKSQVYNRTRAHAPAKVSSIDNIFTLTFTYSALSVAYVNSHHLINRLIDNILSLCLLNKQASYCQA